MAKPPSKALQNRRAAIIARHPGLEKRRAANAARAASITDAGIILGVDDNSDRVYVADKPRLEHAHVIGATGCGKSTFLLNCILQDIARGRGVCVLDPHGGHPDSLLNTILTYLHDHHWFASRKVHIIAPNVAEHVVGFNPLAPLPGTDPSVIAGAMLAAFERAWAMKIRSPNQRRGGCCAQFLRGSPNVA